MMLRIHSDLYVIADDARAAPARRHRTRIRVGQRNLLIGRGQHLLVDRFQTLHLGRQLGKLLLEVRRLRSEGFCWFLQVGGVELAQIPRHALLDLSKPALHLRAREAIERLHEEFKRRIKTQTVPPSAETAAMLFWALLASGQTTMRKVDGWQTFDQPLIATAPLDLAA